MVYNAVDTIPDTLSSVRAQTYPDVEHIIVDGASTDGTLELINQADHVTKLISEPDNGLYHAMNKGIELATGDVIGFLNADDVFQDHNVLARIAETLKDPDLEACYANLVYVKADDLSRVVRKWESKDHYAGLCWDGWMPAHPTLYLKRHVFDRVGGFNLGLKYQSDLEFCARVFEHARVRSRFVPELWVRMRLGGVTNNSLLSIIKGNWESYLALRELGCPRSPLSYFPIKFASRLRQYL